MDIVINFCKRIFIKKTKNAEYLYFISTHIICLIFAKVTYTEYITFTAEYFNNGDCG